MTDAELLDKVKSGLGITGTYQDVTLREYIDDVKLYLLDAGITSKTVNSSVSVGVITRGVADLWNYGAGSAGFSEYFIQRAIQLKYRDIPEPDVQEGTTEYLCRINLEVPDIGGESSVSRIILVNNLLWCIEINTTFIISENWNKDVYYKFGTIDDEKYWPVSDRIIVGRLFANGVEAAKQNFFKVCSNGEIYVYADVSILSGSTVQCIVSDVYM